MKDKAELRSMECTCFFDFYKYCRFCSCKLTALCIFCPPLDLQEDQGPGSINLVSSVPVMPRLYHPLFCR